MVKLNRSADVQPPNCVFPALIGAQLFLVTGPSFSSSSSSFGVGWGSLFFFFSS